MKSSNLLFVGPMVRAILARTKNKTRRVVVPQPALYSELGFIRTGAKDPVPVDRFEVVGPWVHFYAPLEEEEGKARTGGMFTVKSPHGTVGDVIKVRESYRFGRGYDGVKPRDVPTIAKVHYEADGPAPDWAGKLRPGIFLPEWASRIHLRVTSLDVERLGAITNAEARAEGFTADDRGSESDNFRNLWDKVNGRRGYGFDVRPFVWVIGFEAATVR